MVDRNTDANETAFTVSIDAGREHGVSTGISRGSRPHDSGRSTTGHPTSGSEAPRSHFSVESTQGRCSKRAGHTEAATSGPDGRSHRSRRDCEIQNPDGSMARLTELRQYARHGLKLISIADLIVTGWAANFVQRQAHAVLPSQFGSFQAIGTSMFWITQNTSHWSKGIRHVRNQCSCACTPNVSPVMRSSRLRLPPAAQAALQRIEQEGEGVVVYLRQEDAESA